MIFFKKHWRFLLFIVIFIIGMILLQSCVKYGQQYAHNILNGVNVDVNEYLVFVEKSIDKYKSMGIILSLLGGAGIIIDIFKLDIKRLNS